MSKGDGDRETWVIDENTKAELEEAEREADRDWYVVEIIFFYVNNLIGDSYVPLS